MQKKPDNLLSIINTALSAAILLYVIGVEHRITSLEVQVIQLAATIAPAKK